MRGVVKKKLLRHTLSGALFCCSLPLAVTAQPIVWGTPSLQRTGPTDPAGTGTSVQLFAGKGEYESFQIVVQAPSGGLSNVNVNVSNLTGPGGAVIPNTAFSLFREQYVYVSQSSPNWGGTNQPIGVGWYPDGLIPFNDPSTGLPITGASLQAVPFSLSAANNQPIWVDVLVPATAVPGAYSGTFTVTSNQGSVSGTIALTVWHFTLPSTPTLHSSFLYWTADSVAAEEELLRNKIAPLTSAAANQSSLMSGYGLGSIGLPFWSGADVGNCTMSPAPTVSQFSASSSAQQPGLYQYDYSADEIGACPSLFPTVQQWAYNMHQVGLKNLVTMAPNPSLYDDGSGTNHSAVDIWTMLPLSYNADLSQMPVVLAKGDSLWSYNTLVQDSYSPKWEIDFAPINYRIQPGFISQSLSLTGLLYWRVDDWSSDPWNQVNNTGVFSSNNYPGEAMLVYPGTQVGISGVAPSMRLKWLRDGVEDYEYVAMLKTLGQGTWALGLAASVGPDWTNWTRDINLLASVREQLGQELDQLTAPPPPPAAVVTSSPANAATGISMTPALSWGSSAGATSYSVYFGTSSGPASAGSTTGTTFAPGTLASGTTYYWSVVANNANGSTPSATWSFTTLIAAPAAPASPSPGSGSTGVSTSPTLTWSASAGATFYAVYFGTTSTPPLVATIAGTSYAPGTLAGGASYYWKVVAMNAGGSTPSAVWSFQTALPQPVAPAVTSVTPSTGSGTAVTFRIGVSDTRGAGDIAGVGALVNTSVNGESACWFYYTLAGSSLSLANNSTSGWTAVTAGSASVVSNSQCSISGTGIRSAASGTGFTLTVTVTFNQQSFAGAKNVYVIAQSVEGLSSGYQQEGTWTVPHVLSRGLSVGGPPVSSGTLTADSAAR
jgi:hypothetical protein